jgi:GT2 family glycosyltransferase
MGEGVEPVSVVIVNYNAGAMLAECVRAALASSVPTHVYVCDNASYDDSIEYLWSAIGPESRVTVVINRKNLGFARANNVVLPQCRSEWVLFVNPDCVIRPDTIERMIAVMRAHPDAGVAGCLILNPDGSEQPTCRRYIPTPWRTFVRMLRLYRMFPNRALFQPWSLSGMPLPQAPTEVEALSGAFMFVRRSAMDQVGYMDEAYFLHCEDLDWFMRFRRAGWKVLFAPHVSVVHWKGFSSKANPVKVEYHKHRGMVHFYNKFFRERYPAVVLIAVMVAIWARFVIKASWVVLRSPVRLRRPRRRHASAILGAAPPTASGGPAGHAATEAVVLREAAANSDRP